MNYRTKLRHGLCAITALTLFAAACQKSTLDTALSSGTSNSTTSTIAVAARLTVAAGTGTTDSLYLLHPCEHGRKRVPVAQSALPAAIGTYLSSTYSGYTFSKAFSVTDSAGTVASYVVVVYYNNKPVGLEFDAAGSFVRVLEQREPGDCNGGPGHGGRFHDRDGKHHDTVALASLPTAVLGYLAANYPGDTLIQAFRGCDSSLVVLTRNGVVYANAFDAAGGFVNRVQAQARGGRGADVAQADLPAAVLSYLGTTYPNYVFEKAFRLQAGSAVQGYVVILDASGTKYAVEFDASGTFQRAYVIH